MSKKYRLLKDLPDYKAGSVIEFCDETGYYRFIEECPDGVRGQWPPQYVDNNPTWFELINERIEVKYIESFMTEGPGRDCRFYTNGDVPKEKLPLIKQAIEKVLNDDSVFNAEKINAQLDKLKAMEDAFNAARLVRPLPFEHPVYKDYQAFLNGLQQNQP